MSGKNMDEIPKLSFCNILCAYVCLHEKCQTVTKLENLRQHLQRKHNVKPAISRIEVAKLIKPVENKTSAAIASRYYNDPLPKPGESPLPALPLLPLYDIVKCPCCILYFNGIKACKSHFRSLHSTHCQYELMMGSIEGLTLVKGQALFRGHGGLFFPVIRGSTDCLDDSILSTVLSEESGPTQSDELSLWDKSANLSCSVLRIPKFLKSQELNLEKAYRLSRIDRTVSSKIVSVMLEYVKHFAEMQPAMPMPILEGIKIKNGETSASFSLSIEMRSKRRYASVAARFLCLIVRLDSDPLPHFHVDPEISRISVTLFESIAMTGSAPMNMVHKLFALLLLQKPRASKGETVFVEGLFKILIAGYTCGVHMKRIRVGDSDDASHTAAAMQYFCHITALGEFFVSPVGFGAETEEEEQTRFKRIQHLLSKENCSPAAYLRTVLLKTKRLSAGESPRIEFVPCAEHPFCGTVQNIEVQLNSALPGSLGYVVRNLPEDIEKTLRSDLMRNFALPADFLRTALSFPDKLTEKEPRYYFGAGLEVKQQFASWSEGFARHVLEAKRPLMRHMGVEHGGGYGPTSHASTWLRVVDDVTFLLYSLVHLCGGGPPRVTEMVEAKLRNTAAAKRNLFIVKARLAIIGTYSKTTNQHHKPKPIARFLDCNTSELLMLFVVFIKPLQCFFLKKSMLNLRATEDYLFCQSGEKVDETAVSRAFAKALNARGLPLNVSLYRQWRTGVAKAFLAEGKIATNEKILFLQAGHTEATARVRYAGGDFNVGELSLILYAGIAQAF